MRRVCGAGGLVTSMLALRDALCAFWVCALGACVSQCADGSVVRRNRGAFGASS